MCLSTYLTLFSHSGYNQVNSHSDIRNSPLNIPRPNINEMNTNFNNNFIIENDEVIPSSHQRNQFQPLNIISQLFNPSPGGLHPMQMMQQTSFSPLSSSVSTSTVKECVICLNNFEENEKVVTLPCLHIFHSNCVKDWLRKGSPECPICKTTVNSN